MAVTTQGMLLQYTYYIIITVTLIVGIVKTPSLFISYLSGAILTLISAYIAVFETDCMVTGYCIKYSWFRTILISLFLIIPFIVIMTSKDSEDKSEEPVLESNQSNPRSSDPNFYSMDLSADRSTRITNSSSTSNESSSSNVNTG